MTKKLTKWRHDPETAWLADSPCQSQQQAIRDLELAYVNFFEGRANPPKFKRKGKCRDSFRYADKVTFVVDSANGRVRLPKVGWVRYRNSRRVEGEPRQLTVSRDGDHWFVTIAVEHDVPDPVHPYPDSAVGIDLGLVNFATFSTGEVVPPLNTFRRVQRRLAGLQRVLARRVKFSERWKRIKKRIGDLLRKVRHRRADYLHKLTHAISKNHATVCVEELQVRNMTASARGTVEQPGKNVRQKSGMNRAILAQGWGMFRRHLSYKLAYRGGRMVMVKPANTSRTCSRCGDCRKDNRPTQARFACKACGLELNADHNASKNILAAGHAALMLAEGQPGLGSDSRPRLLRKSASATQG